MAHEVFDRTEISAGRQGRQRTVAVKLQSSSIGGRARGRIARSGEMSEDGVIEALEGTATDHYVLAVSGTRSAAFGAMRHRAICFNRFVDAARR